MGRPESGCQIEVVGRAVGQPANAGAMTAGEEYMFSNHGEMHIVQPTN